MSNCDEIQLRGGNTIITLSIIIPHYNSLKSLKVLIDSIPTDDKIEIIVVDDRSTEQVGELNEMMNSEKYRNVFFLKNQEEKKGAGVCRNIGLKAAKGKWVIFADSDDYFLTETFQSIVKQDFTDNDTDVIFFPPTSIDLDTRKKSDRHEKYEELLINYTNQKNKENEIFLRYNFFVPWSKIIKLEFLKEHNIYFDEVIASNDVMFSTKVGFNMKKIKIIDENIYCVTKKQGSLTTLISEEVYDARLDVFISYYKFLKAKLQYSEFKKFNLSGRQMIIAAFKYKFKLKKILNIILKLKKNKINIFDMKLINPFFILKKLKYHYSIYIVEKKYYTS